MQHVCTATDQSYFPYSCLSEHMALTLRKCWAIEKNYFHAICLSEMVLAFCTVTHYIQLNG